MIRIQATGSVIVNGRISANGLDCRGNAGGGAGGSIWITSKTFSGSSGTVEAKGGNMPLEGGGEGGGGGGRIALVFDKAAQRKQPPVTVRFSTAGGQGSGPGEPGTLFLSEADILKTIEAETPPPQPPKEKAPHDTK